MATIDRRGTVIYDAGFKLPVLVATTGANIALTGLQTIDGVAVGNLGERVLVKDQTDTTTNGIYAASTGIWTRTADANGSADFVQGTAVVVGQGTVNQYAMYICSCPDIPIIIGTSHLTFIATNPTGALSNGIVTLAKLAALAANSVIGNNTGSPATPIALTQAQLTALINTFTTGLAGLVPASGGGTANFLRADGAFSPAPSYAQGTWTPTLLGSSTPGAPTYSVQVGSYEQIGRQITCRFNIATTALGGPLGNMQIGGLPFASANVSNDVGICDIVFMSGVTLDASFVILNGSVFPNTSVVSLQESGSAQTTQVISISKFAATTALAGKIVYHV